MDFSIIGPVKVKDGIFMGDEYAAHVNFLYFFFLYYLKGF